MLLETNSAGHWAPGLGDPTPLGWFIVGAYLITAALSWRVFLLSRAREPARVARFWVLLAALFLLAALNKQLDLQTWFTQEGRQLAILGHWYPERRQVQEVFMAGLAAAALVALGLVLWLFRSHLREVGLAVLGSVLLSVFILVRAASFHHVDHFLARELIGVSANHLLEVLGILLVALGARRAAHLRQGSI